MSYHLCLVRSDHRQESCSIGLSFPTVVVAPCQKILSARSTTSCPTNLACIALQSSKSPSDPSIANVDDEFVVMLSLIVHRDRAATLATLMKDLINTIADLVACRLSSLETVMLRTT